MLPRLRFVIAAIVIAMLPMVVFSAAPFSGWRGAPDAIRPPSALDEAPARDAQQLQVLAYARRADELSRLRKLASAPLEVWVAAPAGDRAPPAPEPEPLTIAAIPSPVEVAPVAPTVALTNQEPVAPATGPLPNEINRSNRDAAPAVEAARPVAAAPPAETASPAGTVPPVKTTPPVDAAPPPETARAVEAAPPAETSRPVESAPPVEAARRVEPAPPGLVVAAATAAPPAPGSAVTEQAVARFIPPLPKPRPRVRPRPAPALAAARKPVPPAEPPPFGGLFEAFTQPEQPAARPASR